LPSSSFAPYSLFSAVFPSFPQWRITWGNTRFYSAEQETASDLPITTDEDGDAIGDGNEDYEGNRYSSVLFRDFPQPVVTAGMCFGGCSGAAFPEIGCYDGLDTEYSGGSVSDWDDRVVESASECCAYCTLHDECTHWSWAEGGDQECHLKSEMGRAIANENFMSGLKDCAAACPVIVPDPDAEEGAVLACELEGIRLRGNNLKDVKSPRVPTAQACCDLCTETDGCMFWSWDKGKKCYLKDDDEGFSYDGDYVSGYKDCAATCPEPPPEPACTFPGVYWKWNSLAGAGSPKSPSAAECCALCTATEGCFGWSWGHAFDHPNHMRCYMKGFPTDSGGVLTYKRDYRDHYTSGYAGCDLECPAPLPEPACNIGGVEFKGNNLPGVPQYRVDSGADCCAMCTATEGCEAWSWGHAFDHPNHKLCYLKSKSNFVLSERENRDFFVSGYKDCTASCPADLPEPGCAIKGVEFDGNKLAGSDSPRLDSAADCCDLCSQTDGCLAWTWGHAFDHDEHKRCYLKDSDEYKLGLNTDNRDHYTSGYRDCVAACPVIPEPTCTIPKVHFEGSNMGDSPRLDTAAQCCAMCTATEGCEAWSWGHAWDHPDHKRCYMKDDATFFKLGKDTEPHEHYVSGFRGCDSECPAIAQPTCIIQDVEFDGNLLIGDGHFDPIIDTVEGCCALCEVRAVRLSSQHSLPPSLPCVRFCIFPLCASRSAPFAYVCCASPPLFFFFGFAVLFIDVDPPSLPATLFLRR
jgi:hypothetical protein